MSTKTVHVCDRCAAESEIQHKRLVVTIAGQGSQESRDMCAECLNQLAFFLAHPNEIVIRTPIEPPSVVSISRHHGARH